jgi:hypothetical protein
VEIEDLLGSMVGTKALGAPFLLLSFGFGSGKRYCDTDSRSRKTAICSILEAQFPAPV